MTSIPKNEQNQKQVQILNELSKRKVVEHNSLITSIASIAKMDKTPLKMFELAVSCIDTEEPPKDHTVYLSK
ncbi:RepB protein, partial [Listeria monocytogenes]|nr:RepB protein [Listeria monocytogenes]